VLGDPIAVGRTAEVYPWRDGQVLKLFHADWPAASVALEADNAKAAHQAGLPTPAVGPVLHLNNRLGLIFERVHGTSMLEAASARPWTFYRYDRLLPDLHVRMHGRTLAQLPSLRQRLDDWIRSGTALPAHIQARALGLLAELPDDRRLCHGDFHPGNVLLTSQGPMIIDWFNATLGNPLADVATTLLLLRAGSPPGQSSILSRGLLALGSRWFGYFYLRVYSRLRPLERPELNQWLVVIATAMLNRGLPVNQSVLQSVLRRASETISSVPSV
jgi:Ser/Thr protein kinase RdoA (MazF antagonist)